ncbi:MAG TPA: phage virion morphogenesis protein, partial [Elusimicrobiales bacterium]|nr:phage virion morphogenesis protein [Elusimicrobiales bacterium]
SLMTKARRRKGKGKGTAKILQDTGYLKNSIFPIVYENKAMLVTNTAYAPTHQFGAKKGEFGVINAVIKAHKRRNKRGRKTILVRQHTRKVNAPFGDIPARPFMVLREEDKKRIIDLVKGYIYGKE